MTWTNKYKKSIDCNNPKGFSQKAHCQARKLRQMGKKTESKPVNEARVHKKHADFEKTMNEDAPVNAVAGGAVAGLGVGDQGEPGVNLKKKRKVIPFKMFVRKTTK